MKTAIFAAALLFAPAATLAVPPPTAPPGSGVAEWRFSQVIEREAPVIYDAWTLQLCGIRSNSWLGNLMLQLKIANAALVNELEANLQADPTALSRFAKYAYDAERWVLTNRPPTPTDRETCEVALDRFDAWQAEVRKWSYR